VRFDGAGLVAAVITHSIEHMLLNRNEIIQTFDKPVESFAQLVAVLRAQHQRRPFLRARLVRKSSNRRLDVHTTKNDDGRVFPFTQELRRILETRYTATRKLEREQKKIIPLVFHKDGKPIG
jgi:hypothetical protein